MCCTVHKKRVACVCLGESLNPGTGRVSIRQEGLPFLRTYHQMRVSPNHSFIHRGPSSITLIISIHLTSYHHHRLLAIAISSPLEVLTYTFPLTVRSFISLFFSSPLLDFRTRVTIPH
jgi:hypothetical protein